jgi:hypothetical protein
MNDIEIEEMGVKFTGFPGATNYIAGIWLGTQHFLAGGFTSELASDNLVDNIKKTFEECAEFIRKVDEDYFIECLKMFEARID